MSSIAIENARIIDPLSGRDETGTICIENGTIRSLGNPAKGFRPDTRIDAGNRPAIPGIVDLSARFAKPGHGINKTIVTEAAAAASAGVTTVCCPPDTYPAIDSPAAIEQFLKLAADSGKVRIFPIAALTHGLEGSRLAEMSTLKNAGCVAVSNANHPFASYEIMRRALEYAASTDLTVFIHPVDHQLTNHGVVNEGAISTRLGLPPIPETAETVALSAALLLIEQTGARSHICRVSTGRAVDMIRAAKESGLPVTADVDICHLYLTDLDVDGYNTGCFLEPPLRSLADRDALIRGLADGVLDAICSDHRLLSADSKIAPFNQAKPGAATIETLLPLVLDLATRQKLPLSAAIGKITYNPAKILGLPFGRIEENFPADIVLVDTDSSWTVEPDRFIGSSKCTPFKGWEMQGRVTHTILNGELVYGEAEGSG